VQELDKRVLVMVRDVTARGRILHLYGVLRSFDQFGTVVLEDTVERVCEGGQTAERRRGLLVVRGENLVLLGAVDADRERAALAALGHGARFEDLDARERERISAEERVAHRSGEALGFDDVF
jgi:U6 snRNA-associated Sm-like protein LSm1